MFFQAMEASTLKGKTGELGERQPVPCSSWVSASQQFFTCVEHDMGLWSMAFNKGLMYGVREG